MKSKLTYHINIICLDKREAVSLRHLVRAFMKQRLDEDGVDHIAMTSYREVLNTGTQPIAVPSPSNQKLEVAV